MVTRDAGPCVPADVLTPALLLSSTAPPGDGADIAAAGDAESAKVEESVISEEIAVDETVRGEHSIGVVDMETTNSLEGTVDDLHCNSTSIGDVSPSASGAGCRWDCGSPLGPSTSPIGATLV